MSSLNIDIDIVAKGVPALIIVVGFVFALLGFTEGSGGFTDLGIVLIAVGIIIYIAEFVAGR